MWDSGVESCGGKFVSVNAVSRPGSRFNLGLSVREARVREMSRLVSWACLEFRLIFNIGLSHRDAWWGLSVFEDVQGQTLNARNRHEGCISPVNPSTVHSF